MTINEKIEKYHPCIAAQVWLGRRSNIECAWRDCPDGRWMIWLLGKLHIAGKIDRPTLVLATCAVVRPSLRFVPAGEDRPRVAIETAERWCRGEATIEEVRAALDAAWEYRRTAYAAYAADAAAGVAAAYAAADADAYAAYAAADAAAYAAAVRSVVSWTVVEKALEE